MKKLPDLFLTKKQKLRRTQRLGNDKCFIVILLSLFSFLFSCENPVLKKVLEPLFPEECKVCVYDYDPQPTCTVKGKKISIDCSKHKKHIGFSETVPAIGHNWSGGSCTVCSLTKSVFHMEMITGGALQWGSAEILLSSFQIGIHEVTQELYEAIMGYNPSSFSSGPDMGETHIRRPVESVTWYDAIEFCNKLSIIEGYTPVYTITERNPAAGYPITSATVAPTWAANGYRLPTEAQWEYACRALSGNDWCFGDDENSLVDYAWYLNNSNNKTHEVGKKAPNYWNLHDMHGNVGEWCWDFFYTLPTSNQSDYTGPNFGSNRVQRGGSYNDSANYTTSYIRGTLSPEVVYDYVGFRLVRPQF